MGIKMSEFEAAGVLILLLLCGITDIKDKKINIGVCILFIILGIVFEFMIRKRGLASMGVSILPGCFLYFAGYITRGGIGKGDAVLFIAIGIFIGMMNSILLLICSLFLVSFYALLILTLKKGNRKTKIAFTPFITTAFILLEVFKWY